MIKNISVEREKLKQQILHLGSEVEANLVKAEKALLEFDHDLARDIITTDVNIDKIEISVEEKCLQILAQHQPVASDLRFVVTVLKINNDLERIGDLVAKIADRILLLANKHYVPFSAPQTVQFPERFKNMFAETAKMVKMSLDAFVRMDADLAYKVRLWDDQVDEAKTMIRQQIDEIIQNDVTQQPYLGMLLSVSRSLERIADHATHIAENVIYMLQGLIIRHTPESPV